MTIHFDTWGKNITGYEQDMQQSCPLNVMLRVAQQPNGIHYQEDEKVRISSHRKNHQSVDDKTHVILVNLLYISMFKIKKIKPNSSSVQEMLKSFCGDCISDIYQFKSLNSLVQSQIWWPPNLVTICAWLPKLVANVSYQFQHLVNTRLGVGFLVKWLPIMVAHTFKLDTIWVVYISPIGNGSIGHPVVIAFNTLCSVQFYIQWCVTLHWTHWGSYFEKLICPCLGS